MWTNWLDPALLNTVHCMDCLEFMRGLPDGCIDAIITDPPYGTTACKWDTIIPFEPMREQLKRIIKPNGAIVLFWSEPFSSYLRCSNIKDFRYDIIWEKERPTNILFMKNQIAKVHEIISVFYTNQPTYNPQMEKSMGVKNGNQNIDNTSKTQEGQKFKYSKDYNAEVRYPRSIKKFNRDRKAIHPTQKPVLLIEYLIKTYSNEWETILDFTAGSGTTWVACKNTNRNYVLVEKEEKYCSIIRKRLSNTTISLFH